MKVRWRLIIDDDREYGRSLKIAAGTNLTYSAELIGRQITETIELAHAGGTPESVLEERDKFIARLRPK